LVDMVNQIGSLLIDGSATGDSVDMMFGKLAEYAKFHFANEGQLMAQAGVDKHYARLHQEHHQQFVDQLGGMWKGRAELSNPAGVLHGFLSSWLTFHILDEDQSMARQLARIASGVTANEALEREQRQTDNAHAVLLAAMHTLYEVLAMQNKALAQSNERLEEKVAERTRELLQSEKMAAVGQLAAGVAHEINNPIGFVNSNLGALRGYTGQLLKIVDACVDGAAEYPLTSPELAKALAEVDLPYLRGDLPALLKESQEGLDRVKHIVEALKDFAHVGHDALLEFDALACLESALSVVWSQLKYKVEIVRELSPLPLVCGMPEKINQVFLNLLLNAAHAIADHGVITLRSGASARDVWIEIRDSGCGMTDEVQKHMFEPFFTTRPVGQGTGLGLPICWDTVVNKHAGRIDVTSAPGAGTSCTVWLPIQPHG